MNNNKTKIWVGVALVLIIAGAIWVRTYQHHDWLFFKWDQARDASLLKPAIENGAENLPLLGPRATKVSTETGGTDFLRLGPAYYYMQWTSGAIFKSSSPDVFAYPDLLFSILVIPLFYLFLRLYFKPVPALLATLLYSFSFLIIQYSRFSWNPNSVPFFMLLTIYALLRFSSVDDAHVRHLQENKNLWKKIGWIALWAFAFAVASQLHFYAAFALIAISVVFIVYYIWDRSREVSPRVLAVKPQSGNVKNILSSKNSLFYVLTTLLIFGIIYSPVIISDFKTDFSNTKNFFGAFEAKSKDKKFHKKIIRNFREQAKGYSLITTSFSHRKGHKADPITVGFGLLFIFSGIYLAIKEYKVKSKQNDKNFLFMLIIWIVLFFLVTITTSYLLRPRYFVPVFPIPFIIIALWFSALEKRVVKNYLPLIFIISAIFLLLNIFGTCAWFRENELSQEKSFDTNRTLILKNQDGVTLGQFEKAIEYMLKNNPGLTLIYNTKAEYMLPTKYLLSLQNEIDYSYAGGSSDLENVDTIFALVTKSGGKNSINKKIQPYTKIVDSKQIGQLEVFQLEVQKEKLPTKKEKELAPDEEGGSGKTERLFWKDVL